MSPVPPAQPGQPGQARAGAPARRRARRAVARSWLPAARSAAGIDAAGSGRHDQPVDRREAHRGVHAAAAVHRRERRPGAEVAGHHPEPGLSSRAEQVRGAAAGGIAVRQPMEPELAQPELVAPAGRQRVASTAAAGMLAWNAVSKQPTGAPRAAPSGPRIPASARGWCSGASAVSAAIAGHHRVVDHGGPVNWLPPCTTRCPTRGRCPAGRGRGMPAVPASSGRPSQWSMSSRSVTDVVRADDATASCCWTRR